MFEKHESGNQNLIQKSVRKDTSKDKIDKLLRNSCQ